MPAEYLDVSLVAWRSALESAGHGWGLVVNAGGPPPSGYIPRTQNSRGQTITSLLQGLGAQGRANGVTSEHTANGYEQVTVGPPHLTQFEGVLVAPMNVREEGGSSPGGGVMSVTAESGGEFGTASNAGARFPGRQLVSGSGGAAKWLAEATLNTASRNFGTVQLRAKRNLSGIRVGQVATYVQADGSVSSSVYLRVIGITVDDSMLPTEFVLTGQVIEPDASVPVALTKGAYWPGTKGAGNTLVREIRARR